MRYINTTELMGKRERWGHAADLWTNAKLKKDFRDCFFNKCWYTEVSLAGQDVNIDHFRPKAAVKQFGQYNYNQPLCNSGYNWLANEPANYRACCIYSNRETDNGGKGCYFPLEDGTPYLTEGGNEAERVLLLDPCVQEDAKKISFMGNNVLCASDSPIDETRVSVSRKIYNIDNHYIETERAKVWESVSKVLAEYESENISIGACLRILGDAVHRSAPFSACAIACVNSLAPDEIKQGLNLEL